MQNASAVAAGRPIYLDMQATSPLDPRVLDAMMPYMTDIYGNPHSRTHQYGWETEKAVENARAVSVAHGKREKKKIADGECLHDSKWQSLSVPIPRKLSLPLAPPNPTISVSRALLDSTRTRRSISLQPKLYVHCCVNLRASKVC